MAGESTTQPTGAPEGAQPTEQAQADALKLWNEVAAERGDPVTESQAEQTIEETIADKPAEAEAKADQGTVKDSGAEKPAEEVKDDPFAGLPPAVVERLKRLDAIEQQVQTIPTLQRSLSEAQGRVAAMQRELQQAKAASKAVESAPTATQIAAASKAPEKWAALKADFPEWAEATEAYVSAQLAGLTPQQTAGLSPEEIEARIEQRLSAAQKQAELDRVSERHEGWQETVKTPEFTQWFAGQDETVKRLAASPRARDAIQMLDLYQRARAESTAAPDPGKQNRLAAAVTTRSNGARPAAKTPDQMTPAELWEYERSQRAKEGAQRGLTY